MAKNIPKYISNRMIKDDKQFLFETRKSFSVPRYDPKRHYLDLAESNYYHGLIIFRHYVKIISDYYFNIKIEAKNVDLFMLTSSVSSPTGSGSDSKPVKIKFGKFDTFLVDSSQFGFEPLLVNNLEKVYCYLPSMRGENPDERHLNQFFHCELEMKGKLDELIPIIEGYIKILCEGLLMMENIINKMSSDPQKTKKVLSDVVKSKCFPKISFDEAIEILIDNGFKECINFTNHGRNISSRGEIELMKMLNIKIPMWINNFDRDRVPFYQKPYFGNPDKVINADLLFPPIIKGAFGGEIVGSGQRQDNIKKCAHRLKGKTIFHQNHIGGILI